jgi:hypothetical protein
LWLYEDFKDPRYLSRALELAKSYQVIAPMHAWSFAVVAKYSKDPDERLQALAMALYLDRHSWLVSGIPDTEKLAAQEWFEEMRSQSQTQGEGGEKKPKAPGETQSRYDASGRWERARQTAGAMAPRMVLAAGPTARLARALAGRPAAN